MPSVQESLPVIKQIFCRIFRENSIKLRVKFFSNELVQVLWRKYLTEKEGEIRNYIESLKTVNPELRQSDILLQDVIRIS